MKNSNHGGARIGAGRKKGTKISKNTTVFYANCTEEEKKKLSDYLKQIRNKFVFMICLLIFTSPCFAKDFILQPHNLPAGVNIQIVQTKNSFKVTRYKTSDNYYSLVMNEAVIITADGIVHRLVEPLSYDCVYTGRKLANYNIYNQPFSFELAPVENIRYSALLNSYPENVKIAQIGAFAYPINFRNKKSIIKNNNYKICIPLLNETTSEKTILEFTPLQKQELQNNTL